MSGKTIGERLLALKARSGLTLGAIAQAAGYAGPSSIQAMFKSDYDPEGLSTKVGESLFRALVGKGSPPISGNEVLSLVHMPSVRRHSGPDDELPAVIPAVADELENEIEQVEVMPTLKGQPKDVPVYASALAADLQFDVDGGPPQVVEQTLFQMNEVVTHTRRPPGISSTKVYALYVSGSSMEPRYRPGDPVFVDPLKPPAIGDDVIVQLYAPNDESGDDIVAGLIKTLVKRTGAYLELEQYRPEIRFRVPMERVARIHRVIPWGEAFGM